MDAQRLDDLARLLSARLPRRTPLVAIGLVAFGAITRPDRDAVAKKKKRRKKCKSGTKKCGKKCIPNNECCGGCGNKVCCDGICADLATDPSNCGACNRQCSRDVCVNGACECVLFGAPCPSGCTCSRSNDSSKFACVGPITATPCSEDTDCGLGAICLAAIGGDRCSAPCSG